jgi:hypothetical protein
MSSFMSEHTVEFYLVPRFRALLNSRYSHALPFFYWKTREGGILSHRDDFPALVTACAMFPRRPKVHGEQIEMTVNKDVYLMSKHLQEAGIPTFLGFPRVNSLSGFATDFECLWFLLNLKNVAGHLLDPLGYGPSMLRSKGKRSQDEEVQGTLRQVNSLDWHLLPFRFYREQ